MNIGMCVHMHEAIQWHHLNSSYSYTACFKQFSIGQVVSCTEVKLDSLGSNRDMPQREKYIHGIFA